jgi:hypothetical protein
VYYTLELLVAAIQSLVDSRSSVEWKKRFYNNRQMKCGLEKVRNVVPFRNQRYRTKNRQYLSRTSLSGTVGKHFKMTTILKVSLGLLTVLWGLLSLLYWDETVGFFLTQFVFVPLIGGILLFRQNRKIGISVLSVLFVMVYGMANGPYRDLISAIPFLLLLWFFVDFTLKATSSSDRLFGITLSILTLMKAIDRVPIENNPIAISFIPTLIVIPVYIAFTAYQKRQKVGLERAVLLLSAVLTTLNVVLFNLNFFQILQINSILLALSTILSISSLLGLYLTIKPKRDFILSLLTYMTYLYFAIWAAENMTEI